MENNINENESVFWPPKVVFSEVILNTFGAFIAWIIWSIALLIMVFSISSVIDVPATFASQKIWWATNMLFPFIMSLLALISGMITTISTYKFLNLLSKEKYKNTILHLWQIAFFSILVYIFVAPAYIYGWIIDYNNIMYVFILHMVILIFWTAVILEVMNNYRYVLTGIYWSFIAIFITLLFSIVIFSLFSWWFAKLMVLLFLIPLINSSITFIKEIFQLLYFKYYKYTWNDFLWDIFSKIEMEEEEMLKQEEEENQLY